MMFRVRGVFEEILSASLLSLNLAEVQGEKKLGPPSPYR